MILDILAPILTLSAIAIGAGIMLNEFNNDLKYDERQLIERGKGANLAMLVAVCYLLGIYVGHAFDLLRVEYMAVFAVYGLTATLMVYNGYCIFHDAFLNQEQELGPTVLHNGLIGALWLAMSFMKSSWDPQDAWISGALGLTYLFQCAMLLLRALILRIQDRRAEKE